MQSHHVKYDVYEYLYRHMRTGMRNFFDYLSTYRKNLLLLDEDFFR